MLRCRVFLVAIGFANRHAPLEAQGVAPDSIAVALGSVQRVENLPTASSCTRTNADSTRLCLALIAERRSEITGNTTDAHAAEAALERAVLDLPHSAAAWYTLGLVRLQLARDTAYSRGGALMPVGASYFSGATHAFAQALDVNPPFPPAAIALATVPTVREDAATIRDQLAALRRNRRLLSPTAMIAAASIERDAGSIDSAVALEGRTLAAGTDTGRVAPGLARDLFRTNQPRDGRTILLRGAASRDSVAEGAYRRELEWVASPAELAGWDSLPPGERPAWLASFWESRDIAAGRGDGEALAEHYRRVEYAMKTFRISIPQTGRQKMHTVVPDLLFAQEAEAEKFAMRYMECFPDLGRLQSDAATIGHDTPFDYYSPFQDQVDDRGVIWIRHGAPDARTQSHTGEAVEVWRYDLPTGPLFLQFRESSFSGSVGASTLVPTVLSMSPLIRNEVCSIEQSLCSLSGRNSPLRLISPPGAYKPKSCTTTFRGPDAALAMAADGLQDEVIADGMRIGSGAILHARDEGRAAIDRGTTTDDYRQTFTVAVNPAVVIYGLDRAAGGHPQLVVGFAIPGEQLKATPVDQQTGRVYYAVQFHLSAANIANGRRVELDTLRRFVTPAALTKGEFLNGVADLPLPPGRYDASVTFTQSDGRGAVAALTDAVLPDSSRFSISDVVMGRAGGAGHVVWNSGTTAVDLNPLGTFPSGDDAAVYYQLAGLEAGKSYRTTITFFGASDAAGKKPRLRLTFNDVARQSRVEVARTMGLKNLDPGSYRMVVTVGDGVKSVTGKTRLTVVTR